MSDVPQETPKKNQKSPFNLVGQLLIATPSMTDPRFDHAVILVCGHDHQGTMGIVLNKLLDSLTLSQVLEQLDMPMDVTHDMPVHYGGPIEMGRGFALHSTDYLHESSVSISDDFALTANSDVLKVMASEEKLLQKMLALGYAGWGAGQLEGELNENGWVQMPATRDLIFDAPPGKMWDIALEKLGVRPEMLSVMPGHA